MVHFETISATVPLTQLQNTLKKQLTSEALKYESKCPELFTLFLEKYVNTNEAFYHFVDGHLLHKRKTFQILQRSVPVWSNTDVEKQSK